MDRVKMKIEQYLEVKNFLVKFKFIDQRFIYEYNANIILKHAFLGIVYSFKPYLVKRLLKKRQYYLRITIITFKLRYSFLY